MRVIIKEKGVEYPAKDAPVIKTPRDVERSLSEVKVSLTEEFCVMYLNSKNKLISAEIVTSGISNASLVHPREVFRQAIKKNAAAVVLAHNHPSGDSTPSSEDVRVTKQLVEAGKIIDIKVLDHVIIGDKVYSMREEGLVSF